MQIGAVGVEKWRNLRKPAETGREVLLFELDPCWVHLLMQDAHNPDPFAVQSIKQNMLPMFVPAQTRSD